MKRCLLLAAAGAMALAACAPEPSAPFAAGRLAGILEDPRLDEISGLAESRSHAGILWMHNDGSSGHLFAVGTNGQLVASFQLKEEVDDAEDMALGPGPDPARRYLYLGDIGDNQANRPVIRIYRIPEPALPARPASSPAPAAKLDDAERFDLVYPDGPKDAEALLLGPGSGEWFVVSKEAHRARLYEATGGGKGTSARMKLAAELAVEKISAGDISEDGTEILLRNEHAAWLWKRQPDESVTEALRRAPRPVPVIGPPREPNGESIAFRADGEGYWTVSEGKHSAIFLFQKPRD